MTRTQNLVKTAYDEHLDHLRKLAEIVDDLTAKLPQLPPNVKSEVENYIRKTKQEIKLYAANLEARGVEIYQKVA